MRRLSLLLLLAVLVSGCYRATEIGSPAAGESYRIEVQNQTGVAMAVRYDDGRGAALLGSVPAGRSEFFTIAAPARTLIAVTGVSEGGRTAGPYDVQLFLDRRVTVVLR